MQTYLGGISDFTAERSEGGGVTRHVSPTGLPDVVSFREVRWCLMIVLSFPIGPASLHVFGSLAVELPVTAGYPSGEFGSSNKHGFIECHIRLSIYLD